MSNFRSFPSKCHILLCAVLALCLCLVVMFSTQDTPKAPESTTYEQPQTESTPTPLTPVELDFFNNNTFFDNGSWGGMNIRNQFLSSFYDNPKDVNLFDLFYCGSGQEERTREEAQEILNDIIASVPFYPDCGTTILTTPEINEVLLEHLGLTLDQTNKVGLDEFDYIAAHDAYFHFHGDTNYGQIPYFTSGQRLGSTIRLYYQDNFGLLGFVPCVLTLQQADYGDHYYFYSNQPAHNNPATDLAVPATGELPAQ